MMPDPYFPHAAEYTDSYGTTHYSLPNAVGGGRGPAEWTDEHDCNRICGCHLAAKCRSCNVCTSCDGCYCEED
jgi:hypothetical protein